MDPKAAEARAARKAKINAIAELSKEAGTLKVSCKLNLAACLVAVGKPKQSAKLCEEELADHPEHAKVHSS